MTEQPNIQGVPMNSADAAAIRAAVTQYSPLLNVDFSALEKRCVAALPPSVGSLRAVAKWNEVRARSAKTDADRRRHASNAVVIRKAVHLVECYGLTKDARHEG